MSIFERQIENAPATFNDLIIEAIKLIELQASLNMEDFQMNQWIFLVDGIGMLPIEGESVHQLPAQQQPPQQ